MRTSTQHILFSTRRYRQRVLSIQRQALISYLPLGESNGSVAADVSGNGRNGGYAATGVSLAQPGIGDSSNSVKLDGSAGFMTWYSTSLRDAVNGPLGSLGVWCKIPSAVLTDGLSHTLVRLRADASNSIDINKSTTNNRVNLAYLAGGTNSQVPITSITSLDWIHFLLTWNKASDRVRGYMNGVQFGADLTGLGTWAGTIVSGNTAIGAATTGPTGLWNGSVAHVALWNVEHTAVDALRLGVV